MILLTLLMAFSVAGAEIAFPRDTQGEELLADYIDRVNADLTEAKAAVFNSLFLCFPATASLGVTEEDDA